MDRVKYLVVLVLLLLLALPAYSMAGEKRCTVHGKKVECPVQSNEYLKKAREAFEAEANALMTGSGGSTYGVSAYDYLTGVGKRTPEATLTKVITGYGAGSTGKTELWDRVNKPAPGEVAYNQWVHNWSPKFGKTLVPGADPNEGKTWYYSYCVACHGWNLQGDGPNALLLQPHPRILTDDKYMNKKTNVELFTVIKGGGISVDLSPCMPSWGNYLLDQDIWNVIAFIRAMAGVKPPKTLKDYLHPKSTFNPNSPENKVNALNYKDSEEWQEAQELVETIVGGRGGGDLKGGGFVEGGLRKKGKDVAKKLKKGY